MRIGITGHVLLSDGSEELIYQALRDVFNRLGGATIHGITCLAAGADQVFARAVLDQHGTIEVILPDPDYRSAEVSAENRASFDNLLERAKSVEVLNPSEPGMTAFMQASQAVVERCDLLLAVWDRGADGRPSCTADVVQLARRQGKQVKVIWPKGAARAVPVRT